MRQMQEQSAYIYMYLPKTLWLSLGLAQKTCEFDPTAGYGESAGHFELFRLIRQTLKDLIAKDSRKTTLSSLENTEIFTDFLGEKQGTKKRERQEQVDLVVELI